MTDKLTAPQKQLVREFKQLITAVYPYSYAFTEAEREEYFSDQKIRENRLKEIEEQLGLNDGE